MKKNLIFLIGGILFGFGLAFSSMTKPEEIISFLELQNLGLLFVMIFSILVVLLVYNFSKKQQDKRDSKSKIDKKLIWGSVLFGVGWGISGICPGGAIASIGTGNYPVLVGIVGMFLGAYFQDYF